MLAALRKGKTKNTDHGSFLAYKNYRWLKISVLICVLSAIGYWTTDFDPVRNGGTWYGYTLGVIGVLIILWLSVLGIRKRAITQGHWSLKAWTSAHIYLGLSLVIIGTLHTGFQFGWNVHTLSYALMMFVILSGLFGIYVYAAVPRKMSNNRAEMSQQNMLDDIAALDNLLRDTARPLRNEYIPIVERAAAQFRLGGSIFRRLSGRDNRCATYKALEFFRSELRTTDDAMRSPVLDIISVLERKNSLLGRARKHIRYKAILQIWLFIHIPFTFALIAALAAHIIAVFYYN